MAIRLHELSKEYNISNKEAARRLKLMGHEDIKAHPFSPVTDAMLIIFKATYGSPQTSPNTQELFLQKEKIKSPTITTKKELRLNEIAAMLNISTNAAAQLLRAAGVEFNNRYYATVSDDMLNLLKKHLMKAIDRLNGV